jgi:hypothetical protein
LVLRLIRAIPIASRWWVDAWEFGSFHGWEAVMSSLITVDRARQAIARTNWPTSEIDRVGKLVEVASLACQHHCRREFARTTRNLILAWRGNPLWLPHPPVHNVSSVQTWPGERALSFHPVLPAGWLKLSSLDLDRDREEFEATPARDTWVRVIYESGFDPIPQDIQEAVALWTASLYWQSRQDPTVSPPGAPPAAARLLAPYRRALSI